MIALFSCIVVVATAAAMAMPALSITSQKAAQEPGITLVKQANDKADGADAPDDQDSESAAAADAAGGSDASDPDAGDGESGSNEGNKPSAGQGGESSRAASDNDGQADEAATADDSDSADGADSGDAADESDDQAADEDDEALDLEVDPEEADVDATLPAQSFKTDFTDAKGKVVLSVSVEAPEGALPAGTTMQTQNIPATDVKDAAKQAIQNAADAAANGTATRAEQEAAGRADSKIERIQAVDIAFHDADGNETEPEVPVTVTFATPQLAKNAAAGNDAPLVMHVDDEGNTDIVDSLTDKQLQKRDIATAKDELVFDADAFSVYALVYTVDFEYSVNGKVYQFSLPGGEKIALSDLIEVLGIIENTSFESVDEFVRHIDNVEFSDPELVRVALVDGEWILESLQAFSTEETLTITMKNGDVVTVKVTDASQVNLEAIIKENGIDTQLSASQSSTDVSRSGTISVHLEYTIDNDKLALARANNVWVYDLSDFFSDPTVPFSGFPEGIEQSGRITENNLTKGRFYIEGDKIYFEMNQSYINSHTDITGTIDVTLQLDETKVGSSGSSTFTFPGTTDELTVTYTEATVTDSWKSVSNTTTQYGDVPVVAVQQENGNYKLNYNVTVRPNASFDSLILSDTMGDGQTVDKASFIISLENGQTYSVPASAINESGDTFTVDIASVIQSAGGSIKSGTKYTVSYSTNVDADKVDGNTQITNSASWNWTGNSVPTNTTTVKPQKATTVSKSVTGAEDADEDYLYTLTYTITVGDSANTDVSGVTVQDWLQDYQLLDGSSIVVKDKNGTVVHTMSGSEIKWTDDEIFGDSQKALFEYTFPDNSNNGPYTITYTTRVPANVGRGGQVNVTNRVTTTDGGSDDTGYPVDFGNLPSVGASIDKSFGEWQEVEGGDGKVAATWTIDVNVAADATLPLTNVVVTEADCYTATSGWYPKSDAVIDYNGIVVKNKATGEVISSGYTVDAAAGTITFASLEESVTIELTATSAEAMPENGWFENSASLTVNGKPAGSDKDNRQYGSTTFDKSVSYDESSEVFTWTVRLNSLRNTMEPDVPVYFSDLLPEGMQLLNVNTGSAANPSININVGGGYWDNWNQDVTVIGREIQRTNITHWTPESNKTVHAEAGLSGCDYTITYKTKLTDSELASFANDEDATKTYLNTAFYYSSESGSADGEATRDVTYSYKVLEKALTKVSKDTLTYKIDVNQKGVQLNGGQEMTLVDTLTTTSVDLLLDSVRIVDESGNGVVGATAVYNDDARTLTITVPDGMHVIVTYDVIAQNTGEQTFRNSAELNGTHTWAYEDVSTRTISEHGSTVHGSGFLSLSKIDENYIVNADGSASPKTLPGAKFKLYRQDVDYILNQESWSYTGTGAFVGEPVLLGEFTSNDEGAVSFPGVQFDYYDKLYYWVETEAPAGYALDTEATQPEHYFVLYPNDTNPEVEATNKAHADLLDELATSANGKVINKIVGGSAWTVVNKTDGLTIDVTKVWKDSTGANKTFEEDQTIYFKLYQVVGDGAPTLYDPAAGNPGYTNANYNGNGVWKIAYSASGNAWEAASIAGLPDKVDGVACSYYVEEVNANGSVLSSLKDYIVSYKAGSNQAKAEASEALLARNGSIVITNSDLVTITASKVWRDNNNSDGTRPTSITLHLLQDGTRLDASYDRIVEDNGSGAWATEWTRLESGHTYTVEEEPVPGYAVTYAPAEGLTAEGNITVTNTDNRAELTVRKEWQGTAPTNVAISVDLLKNGAVIDTKSLTGPDWSYTWKLTDCADEDVFTVAEHLPAGFEYVKTVYTDADGYTYYHATHPDRGEIGIDPTKDPTDGSYWKWSEGERIPYTGMAVGGTAVITNKPVEEQPDKTQVVVQKQWVDDEGNALPAAETENLSATVQLVKYRTEKVGTTLHFVYLGGGTAPSDETGIAGSANISISWSNNVERAVCTTAGYTADWQVNNNALSGTSNLWGTKNNALSFTNNNYSDLYVYFMQDPGEITMFTADRASGGETEYVGPVDGEIRTLVYPSFTDQFYNLDTTETVGGKTYNLTYAIEEVSVDGFTTEYSTDGESFSSSIAPADAVGGAGSQTITVKNTQIPVETKMTVRKNWVTQSGTEWPDGASVQAALYKTVNGTTSVVDAADLPGNSATKVNPVTLTASKPEVTWNHLPAKETIAGTEYDVKYSVAEVRVNGVTEGSYATETVTSENGKEVIITNAEKVDVPIIKTWAEPLEEGKAWSAEFTLKQQKRLLLVNGVPATQAEIMAVEGVDEQGWSPAETVMDGEDVYTVTLTNGDQEGKTVSGLPVSVSDEHGNTYMLRYTVEETNLIIGGPSLPTSLRTFLRTFLHIGGVPSLNMYSAEATNASPDNAYEGITVTNTPITVDVPVEKTWADFDADGDDWSATLRLQWAPIYEGGDSATSEFRDVEPLKEITITKAMMAEGDASLLQRTFANMPKYGYDTVQNKPYRIQYSVEEISYTATKDGTTYTFTKSDTPGQPDTYTPAGEENQYVPFFPHDGGELSEDDSDYYVQVSNHKRNTKDKTYLDLLVSKTWSDEEIADMDDAYATFQVKYNKRVEYRDISRMSDADKAADPITVTLKDSSGNILDTIQVRPMTGIYVDVTVRTTQQYGATVSGNVQGPENNQNFSQYVGGGDKATIHINGTFYPTSSNNVITLNITGGDGVIDSARLTDTTRGSDSEIGVVATTFTLNKANHWSTVLNLLSQETLDTSTNPNIENVEVYEYYLEETGSSPAGFAARFLKTGTELEDGDQYNPISKSTSIEARNEDEPKLVVKKHWRGVPVTTGYPTVTFTLYQCPPGCDNVNNATVYVGTVPPYEGAPDNRYTGIPLSSSTNPEVDFTWTCPETLPARDANGNRVAYFVVEDKTEDTVDGTKWELYGYSQGYVEGGTEIIADSLKDQPYNAQIVGNDGTLMIHNKMSKSHEMDIKKQYFMIKEDGSWFNVTADMTRNVVLGFKVIRRVVSKDGQTILSNWHDYGDEMLCGYGPNGENLENNGNNDFWLQYAGLWHWTIHENGGSLNAEHIGLPLEGFYTDPETHETIAVNYQYSFRETNVYKDLNRTPYPEWEWYSTIVPDRYMDQNGSQVSGEFGLAFPNHDGERVANYQASDLLVTKRWIGEPNAKEVYVKIWRQADGGEPEDFTAEISKDIRGDYPASHPAYGNSNWQGYLEDTSEIDASVGHEWLVLAAQPDGDWTSRMKIHNALIKTTGAGGYYTYSIEEVGYKDKEGNVHMKGDDPDPFVDLETHYTRWVGGKYGHWEVSPSTNGADKSISIGATGENKLQVMNAPKMDLTVEKKWFNADGNETTPWMDSVTFQIEQVATKWVQGAPTSETRTSLVKIEGQDTFTLSKTTADNGYWTVDVTDHEGRHDTYIGTNNSSKAAAWTFYVDGLYEGYFDANNDEWHCVYTIKEIDALKSDVTIENNGVSSDGETVTIKNTYSETGSVKITKTFSGIDALPDSFVIVATWTDSQGSHSLNLKATGEQPENVTLSGDGSAENPYVWTIAKIPVGTNVAVSFTENAYNADGYDVTVSSVNDTNVTNENPSTTVEVAGDAINRGDFVNAYTQITGGMKITKQVTVNGAETSGTLADGEYIFRIYQEDGITQATDANGDLVEDISIIITNGVAEAVEIDNLIPGTYKVMEINGTNPAVTLDYTQKTVTVVGKQTGEDIAAEGIATITNNLETVEVSADKRWIDGNDEELETWPEGATAVFGVFAGNSTTPLATVELNGVATPEESIPADGDNPAVEGIPANGDTPVGYEANKEGKESGGGLAIFKNLPKKDKTGKTIVYTIKEIGEPQGFVNQDSDGVANGGTITNKQEDEKGSLAITKNVTVNGHDTTTNLADGAYVFSIAGPSPATTVVKYVQIIVADGKAANYKVADGPTEPVDWSTVEDAGTFAADAITREAVVSNLAAGDYTITETAVPGMTTTVSGGKENKDKETANTITVTVTAGETISATAQATFNNDTTPMTSFNFNKIWLDPTGNVATPDSYQDWQESITVTIKRKAGASGDEDDNFALKYAISKSGDSFTATLETTASKIPEVEGTLNALTLTGSGSKVFNFKLGDDSLRKYDDAGTEWVYYVVEDKVALYVTSYGTATTGDSGTSYSVTPGAQDAKDGGVIVNQTFGGYELPSTGGPGTRLYTTLGSILILGAGVLLWRRRRFI